jgi:hypothetical protein
MAVITDIRITSDVARRHSLHRFIRRTFPDVSKQEIRCGGGKLKL